MVVKMYVKMNAFVQVVNVAVYVKTIVHATEVHIGNLYLYLSK